MNLREELLRHEGKTVFLGTRSSFFFVGPAEEAISEMSLVSRMEQAYAALIGKRVGFAKVSQVALETDIGERNVIETYVRESGEPDELVILIEGREFGAFWTREEYLAGKQAFIRSLAGSCSRQESCEALPS